MDPHGGPAMDPPQGTLRLRSQGSPRKVFPKDPPLGIPPVTPRENQPQEFPLILPTPTWDKRNIAHVQSYLLGEGLL